MIAWHLFKVGDRVESVPDIAHRCTGTVKRVRLRRRGSTIQNVNVHLDPTSDDPCAGKVIRTVNSCWQVKPNP
jgi:hypothetical protein